MKDFSLLKLLSADIWSLILYEWVGTIKEFASFDSAICNYALRRLYYQALKLMKKLPKHIQIKRIIGPSCNRIYKLKRWIGARGSVLKISNVSIICERKNALVDDTILPWDILDVAYFTLRLSLSDLWDYDGEVEDAETDEELYGFPMNLSKLFTRMPFLQAFDLSADPTGIAQIDMSNCWSRVIHSSLTVLRLDNIHIENAEDRSFLIQYLGCCCPCLSECHFKFMGGSIVELLVLIMKYFPRSHLKKLVMEDKDESMFLPESMKTDLLNPAYHSPFPSLQHFEVQRREKSQLLYIPMAMTFVLFPIIQYLKISHILYYAPYQELIDHEIVSLSIERDEPHSTLRVFDISNVQLPDELWLLVFKQSLLRKVVLANVNIQQHHYEALAERNNNLILSMSFK